MSRIQAALLPQGAAFSQGKNNPMVDLQSGGQMGYSPNLSEWVSNQAYVRKNLIAIVVEAPKGFQFLPDPQYWVGTLRALVELQAMSIDGLNAGLEVETGSNPVGGGGQMQEDPTDVKETLSNVVIRWNEKYGMPVANFMMGWIRNLIMDPNTKTPNVMTLANAPQDWLADMYTATMLFIEPDPTMTKVVKSWLVTNMYPKITGEITGRRDMTQAAEPVSYDINFTGIAQYSLGVDVFAQQILAAMSITGANPYLRQAFVDQITADLLATQKGYSSGVQNVAQQAIIV